MHTPAFYFNPGASGVEVFKFQLTQFTTIQGIGKICPKFLHIETIGTPPNLIISGLRAEAGLGSFGMFDFTPVGLSITLLGVVFIGLVGWRLVPGRAQTDLEGFDTGTYLTEALVP